MKIHVKVNGIQKTFDVEPHDMLLDTLRDHGYMGVKYGCGTGSCGSCTVLMNEKPVLSCGTAAVKADGCEIVTIEGVEEEALKFGKFLCAEGGDQCGYCAPALVLTVIALKNEIKNPSDEQIHKYLLGNLCRCTGYASQMRAIKNYLEA